MTADPSSTSPRGVQPSINAWSAEYLDAAYAQFKADPNSVPADVRAFCQGFDLGAAQPAGGGASTIEIAADRLVEAYRTHGHLAAQIDPLGGGRGEVAALSLSTFGLSESDLGKPLARGGTLGELVGRLKSVYSGTLGAEFMHAPSPEERAWWIARLESPIALSEEHRRSILGALTQSETLERWLSKRYQGKKRFSLEGGETLIPMLRMMTDRAGELGTREIIVGMAHRGRLNVLRNYLGKGLDRLITEFEDSWTEGADAGGGDVKYHRGYSFDQITPAGPVHLSMLNNPSHLESVNPLVMGRARARQDAASAEGRDGRREIAALLIHGDAAVIGQGVVAECINMSYLEGYHVGGTLHVVINNQVGFTTDASDSRSTSYCTDVSKITSAPVLHVNGDDPEACVRAAWLAIEYRHAFGKDVWIDLVCFRKHGHNEQDEPGYTQPGMYAKIRAHPGTRAIYAERLERAGVITSNEAQGLIDAEIALLDEVQTQVKSKPVNPVPPPGQGRWAGFVGRYSFEHVPTAVSEQVLAEVCGAYANLPGGFTPHSKLKGLLESRANLPKTKKLNHADGEQLAFGTLLLEGTPIRLSGQDCRRGTFTQRHAVLRDEKTGERVAPLNHIREKQAKMQVWDSPLSEYSVMGFDYGYSRANPHALVMWEGQFGDFCNTAQVIIDQFMAASEVKWDRWAGLVLMLPHGYEGQGPEHSSARLERFLQLCADENMEVVYPSTGAQMFHLLRRHVKRNFRKPLIVMTPKKFLRVETATTDELVKGRFEHAIDDAGVKDASKVRRVIYCTGKVFHELAERRAAIGNAETAIVRIEQLYPFHAEMVRAIDGRYPKAAERVWMQEEPRNAGAFLYIADVFREKLGVSLAYCGRPASASPATGSEYAHKRQQEAILSSAIGPLGPSPEGAKPEPKASPSGGVNGSAREVVTAKKAATKAGR